MIDVQSSRSVPPAIPPAEQKTNQVARIEGELISLPR